LIAEAPVKIEHYRERLLKLEHELVDRLGRELEAARDARSAPGDLARVDELKDEYFALVDTDAVILAHVQDALKRIRVGTFGKCTVDGGPIDEKRLEAVPWTPYCLQHERELEDQLRLKTPSL
jgi:DnaK suppressor protein